MTFTYEMYWNIGCNATFEYNERERERERDALNLVNEIYDTSKFLRN